MDLSNFSDVTLDMLLDAGISTLDGATGGKIEAGKDATGDRAEAGRIFFTECAELCESVRDLARQGASMERIREAVGDAKDIPEAMKLLKDPSLTVVLDGEETTADDDAPVAGAEPPATE